jgi:segregation and condensation protein B
MSKSARKARRAAAAQEAAEAAAAAAAAQGEAQIVELTVVEETTVVEEVAVEEVAVVEETQVAEDAPAEEGAAEEDAAEEGASEEAVAEEAAPVEGEAVSVEGDAAPAEDAPAEDAAAVVELPPEELRAQAMRVVEAMIFASSEALSVKEIAKRLPKGMDVAGIVEEIETHYAARGVNLVRVAGKLAFRTASDVAEKLKIERVVARKLSKAATETLAIVAYQTAEGRPVTRAEIEEIRGVALSKGTLEILMEAEFVQPKGHRETPGRPVTYATTDKFLEHFGLDSIKALPGLKELRELGLLDTRPAVSAYSEDGGLAEPPTMGEAAEEEEGPIDEREIASEDRPSAEIVELHAGSDSETVEVEAEETAEAEAVEEDSDAVDDDVEDDDDDESEFEDDDEDDEDFDDEGSSGEESSEALDEEAVDEDTERKPE